MDILKQGLVGLVALVAADVLWIGVVANSFYRREIGPLLRMRGADLDPRLLPAALLYVLLVTGLLVFALPRARDGSLAESAAWCAAFGVIAYGVYDLTNYATLQGFTLRMTVVDMAWGGVLCALTGAAMWTVRPG